ncbi:DUF927 domain-containing protein [Gilvimarinus agarilyticus]|uniref:DUF927 domain-containing protein n=1 Tax=Gilvimarinus sp. 2_MG-2023 TaxID=3062666 RepID=UPI001C0A0A0E|nr:DUF927 domain-containing protein [Gilvimarinus sp. 2_MG-2023]MBU2886737.1 DUF927 domain-containing protein [Gilvimarinus agarilyticus]MDO6571403.1 DUF927 domain-containing protein [Gilvimarinus sp. 2_MG-2023]
MSNSVNHQSEGDGSFPATDKLMLSNVTHEVESGAGESQQLDDSYKESFLMMLAEKADEKGVEPEKFFSQVQQYLKFMPDYIPSFDDEQTIEDDSRMQIDAHVKRKLGDALGGSIPKPPPGFRYISDSLYFEAASGPEVVSSLIFAGSRGYNAETGEWAVRLVFLDHSGDPVIMDIPAQLMQKQGELVKLLLSKGFRIFRTGGKELKEYLMSVNPTKRMQVFHRQGLVTSREGYHYFILNGEVIGDEDAEIMYLPQGTNGYRANSADKGTLDQWKANVAAPCSRSPMLIFMLCVAFVPIITKALGRSSFAVALHSESSSGKTTGLQVCASTIGPGGDPSRNQLTCINNCRHTNNHLEVVAQAYDSQPLLLDEIGMSEGKDVGQMLYMLIDGRGKGRMGPGAGSGAYHSWHTIPVVTGEQSFLSFIRAKDGSLKNGHIARVLDIPVSQETMIVPGVGQTGAALADMIKEQCLEYYGTAFKSFTKDFIDTATKEHGWFSSLKDELETLAQSFRSKVDRSHEKRAAEHFAVIRFAGKLAVNFGVLPFSQDGIINAVDTAFEAWCGGLEDKDELEYAIDGVREYLSRNQHAFINPQADAGSTRHLGYKMQENGVECLAFEEATLDGVLDPTIRRNRVYSRLHEQGALLKLSDDRYTVRRTVPGKGNLKLIVLRLDFLSA